MSTDLGMIDGARGEPVEVTRFAAGGGAIGFQLTMGTQYVTLSPGGVRELADMCAKYEDVAASPPSTPDLEKRLDAIEERLERLER